MHAMPLFSKGIGCAESTNASTDDGDFLADSLLVVSDGFYQSSHVFWLS